MKCTGGSNTSGGINLNNSYMDVDMKKKLFGKNVGRLKFHILFLTMQHVSYPQTKPIVWFLKGMTEVLFQICPSKIFFFKS